ncbi:MAG: Asp-tRNA(Asn)/Glu-tRNA(Gln) amidotransferase subunit GatC [Saprospiraceae bacterium]|nr:Asp-tRNA(Asn)/Glu-tRNA(Gln) amidotransferase subunit GatC [Saprospiraceae bacterium]
MIKVDDALILKLENLARLQLNQSERASLKEDLEAVLQMVEKLGEVDTEGVEPLRHITRAEADLREDTVKGQLTVEQALLNAPVREPPFFKVPKVIDRS